MFNKFKIIHFVGIGGVGMSGIAEILHNLGYEVTGSDIKESETTVRLKSMGIKVFTGHDGENVDHAHVVVTSSAVFTDNPEIIEAKHRSIPVITRAEMLAELGKLKYGILIAGTHGKTTTTSLVATILDKGGLDPTVVIGGKLKSIESNAKRGLGDYLVAEADESDGSFLKLNPTIAIVTNIDRDHMDFFKDMRTLKQAFLEFINKMPFYGIAVVCKEDEHIREILPLIQKKVLTYGLSDNADIHAKEIKHIGMSMCFETILKGVSLGVFTLPMPGVHNVLNSLAAIATAVELQIPIKIIKKALSNFSGIYRRFEFKGEALGISVFDDYGHHPSEIRATLKAAKECFNGHRLFVLFQPHRYTRTEELMDEFATSLSTSNGGLFKTKLRLFLMDIYSAGEKPIEGINSRSLLNKIKETGCNGANYISDRADMVKKIISEMKSGDVLITLGAGDVYKMGEEVLKQLKLEI